MTADEVILDARWSLIKRLADLPQARVVEHFIHYDPFQVTEDQFIAFVLVWLDKYDAVVAQMRTTAAGMSSELTELRSQRKAVRDFLGLNQTGTP